MASRERIVWAGLLAAGVLLAGCGTGGEAEADLPAADAFEATDPGPDDPGAPDEGVAATDDGPAATDDGPATTDDGAPDAGPQPPVCQAPCELDEDCGFPGDFCASHRCTRKHAFCFDERWSMNDRGDLDDCDAYRCDPLLGLCRRTADSTSDCNVPWQYWDVDSTCVPTVTGCDPTTPECQAAIAGWVEGRDAWRDLHPAPALPPVPEGCRAWCTRDADCAGNEMCSHGDCRPLDLYCDLDPTDGWVSVWPHAGELDAGGNLVRDRAPCGAGYACNLVTGECRTDCLTSADCQGLNCDPTDRRCK